MINTKEIEEEKLIKEIRSQVHRTPEELKQLDKENNIKLLRLLKYLKKRNYKKIQKGNCN